MTTRYDVRQTVWFFNPNTEALESAEVEAISITEDGVLYRLGNLALPEHLLWPNIVACKAHYKALFEK